MTLLFRAFLILGAFLSVFMVIKKIKKSHFKIEDSLFWILFSGLILFLSIFPEITFFISEWLGVESPTNLVFLIIIFLLIVRNLSLTEKISYLNIKFEELVIKTAEIHDNNLID